MPQNLNVSLNFNLQVPPALANQQQLAAALQQMVQQAQQAVLQQAQQAVQQALQAQAPLAGIEAAFRDGEWKRVT
jgi:hypothetical protein